MESWNHHFTSGKVSNTLYSSKLDPSKSLVTTDQEYSYFQDPHSYFYSPNFSQNRYAVDSQNFQGSTAYVYSTHIAAAKLTTTQLENFMEEDEIHRIYLNKTLPQLNTDRFMNRTDGSTLRHEGYFSFDTSQADQVLFTPYFGNEQKVDESYREGGYNHNLLSDLLSKPNHYTSLLDKKDTQENLQRLNNSFIDRQLNLSSVDFGAPLYNSAQYLSKLTSVNDCDQIIGDKSYTDPFLNETFSLSLEKNQLQANLPESSDKNWTEVEKKINKILEAVSNQSSYILPPIIEKSEKESPTSPTETTAGSLTSIKDEAILSELNIDTNSQLISELKDCVSKYRRDSNIVIGLKNSGLSCYINVILHCLLNAPLLAHYLLERYHDKERNPKSRGMISYIFGEMLTILSKHDANLNNSDVAQDLNESASFLRLHMSWKLNSSFQRGIQNDAIEFLKMFLGEMSEELNRVTYKPAYQELSTSLSPGESLQAKSQEWLRSLLVRENSIVTDLFGGQLLNTQYCRCSNKVSFDLFWDISLPINQKNTKFHTLEDLLRDYLQKEVLDKSCDCAKCFSPTVLKTQIWRLPEILVFTFKRFRTEGIWQKIDDSVIFPVKNLDLSSFIEESSDKSVQNANYTLFGIVKHAGSLDGGHYTAECLNIFNQKWYQLNDDYVENSRLTKETELYSSFKKKFIKP